MEKLHTEVNFYWDYFFKNAEKSEEVSRVKFLRTLPFFKRLSLRQVRTICNYLHFREYSENEYLFEYGNPGAALFLIHSGKVAIEIPTENEIKHVATLESHSFLGELALLSSAERTASARTMKRTRCLALFRSDLNQLGDTRPEIALEIYRSLAKVVGIRLEATTKKITSRKSDTESNNAKPAA